MQHLNLFRFYELAAKLHGLFNVNAQSRVADMFAPLTDAQAALDSLIKGDPLPLETSKTDASRLLNKIADLFNKYFIDQATKQLKAIDSEDRINQHELAMLHSMVEKFEHALAAELNRAPSYIAEKRGIFSTHDLIENAYLALPESLHNVIPSGVQNEFNSAGRAMAFGLGTAAAIHMLRAIELQLREYFELYAGNAAAKNERNFAMYLKKLSVLAEDEVIANRPDRRIIQMLAQIKDHYRTPLLNADTTLSVEQATALFSLASAIVTMMAEQIQNRQNNTGANASRDAKPTLAAANNKDDEDEESYDFRIAQTA